MGRSYDALPLLSSTKPCDGSFIWESWCAIIIRYMQTIFCFLYYHINIVDCLKRKEKKYHQPKFNNYLLLCCLHLGWPCFCMVLGPYKNVYPSRMQWHIKGGGQVSNPLNVLFALTQIFYSHFQKVKGGGGWAKECNITWVRSPCPLSARHWHNVPLITNKVGAWHQKDELRYKQTSFGCHWKRMNQNTPSEIYSYLRVIGIY